MRPLRAVLQVVLVVGIASSSVPAGGKGHPRQLSFRERVDAQRAIERVYYDHQIANPVPFEDAVSEETLRDKVRTYLKQSAALERFWDTPVTAEMLRAEAARMAQKSRMPERLREIQEALGDDPILIQECLVRPALVDRVSRSFFAFDQRLQQDNGRRVGWDDWWTSVEGALDEASVPTVAVGPENDAVGSGAQALTSPPCKQFDWQNGGLDDPMLPTPRSGHHAVWTGSLMITWQSGVGGDRYDPATDTWSPVSTTGAPSPSSGSSAVWAGNVMIIWGGNVGGGAPFYTNAGARYNPVTDTWSPMSGVSAPTARAWHTAVWTGQVMLVIGGEGAMFVGPHLIATTQLGGGAYSPESDAWSVGPGVNRRNHTAVWTGTQLLIWGGGCTSHPLYSPQACASENTQQGYVYDYASGTLGAMSITGAPTARSGHSAVWTGSQMVVWGGTGANGARYNLAADTWQPVSTTGAPTGYTGLSAVWSGSRMIVWAGNAAFRYDPIGDSWSPTSTVNAPSPRTGQSAVWTGSLMIIWGGSDNTGGRYNPATDSWTPTARDPRPNARSNHFAVWTGSLMLVWGGSAGSSGGRYDPALDSWTPTSLAGAPSSRVNMVAVWAGGRLVVWGGYDGSNTYDTGGRYDPISDSWAPTSLVGAPSSRELHVAVSTGTKMIVWGGQSASCIPGYTCSYTFYVDGGRYDPVADTWSSINVAGAPSARINETAVWTGTRMIVWGGNDAVGGGEDGYLGLNSGARYDPATDAWTQVSLNGAPARRRAHQAVWTGTEMIVWGGYSTTPPPCGCVSTIHTDGGRYNPATDSWTTVSTVNAPTSLTNTAIWTGNEMIIWGGEPHVNSGTGLNTGARYDPTTNSWAATPLSGAPSARYLHSAVWTGSRMIVWGGAGAGGALSDGGQLVINVNFTDADGDGAGSSCDCDDSNPAVYPGAPQVCGDGLNNECDSPNWPSLAGTNEIDDDGDGLSECAGDCDDTRSAVRPGAPQVCDGINDDCSDPLWPAVPGNEADADSDGSRICAGDCDDTRADIRPGAAQLCDGMNNNCSDPAWPTVPLNEADQDGDGVRICGGDCDDTRPSVYPNAPEQCDGLNDNCLSPTWPSLAGTYEVDDDGDGLSECAGDCDDTRANVYPGAPEVCDGLTTDCAGPYWPGLPPAEADADGDGVKVCGGDCADNNPATYPGAPEANDGADNQCPGSAGYGVVDEVSGDAGFSDASLPSRFCWSSQPGATGYSAARSASPVFAGACDRFDPGGLTCWDDSTIPAPGTAYYYLVRALTPHTGSWGQDSTGAERQNLCSSLFTFTFVDAPGDSIGSSALTGFFSSMPSPLATDHIYFEIRRDANTGTAWCAERADFYRANYLASSATGGSVTSGSWVKWFRADNGGWSGGETAGYLNLFGSDCYGAGSWCAESGLGGTGLDIVPADLALCEAVDESYGCSNGSTRLTIRVGPDRLTTCGF